MPSDSDRDDERDNREELEYDELQRLLKNNLGTIIRDVSNRDERVRFSRTRRPDKHSTVIQAAVWHTTKTNRPKYMIAVVRSLDSSTGRSVLTDGNEYFDSYHEAVERIESLAEEFDGEPLTWRDLPKKPVCPDGTPFEYPEDDNAE